VRPADALHGAPTGPSKCYAPGMTRECWTKPLQEAEAGLTAALPVPDAGLTAAA
jgi:hypothetical protein